MTCNHFQYQGNLWKIYSVKSGTLYRSSFWEHCQILTNPVHVSVPAQKPRIDPRSLNGIFGGKSGTLTGFFWVQHLLGIIILPGPHSCVSFICLGHCKLNYWQNNLIKYWKLKTSSTGKIGSFFLQYQGVSLISPQQKRYWGLSRSELWEYLKRINVSWP